MATFNAALATGEVASFNMVIPNGCDDGEANCKPVNNRYTQFDDFLAQEVPQDRGVPGVREERGHHRHLRRGRARRRCRTQERVRLRRPRRVRDHQPARHRQAPTASKYFHYSLLRTIEDGFGLGPYLGNANAVTPIASIWRAPVG